MQSFVVVFNKSPDQSQLTLLWQISSSSRFDGSVAWTLAFRSVQFRPGHRLFNGIQIRALGSPISNMSLEDKAKTQAKFCCWLQFSFKIYKYPSFFIIPCTLTRFSVPDILKHPHSIILPPPCFTVLLVVRLNLLSLNISSVFVVALVSSHLTKGWTSSKCNLSPGCI